MKRTLIIGCGGVASVAIHKCCQNSEVFEEIMIASRTKSKCDKLKEELIVEIKNKNLNMIDDASPILKRILRLEQITSNPKILNDDVDFISGKEQELKSLVNEIMNRDEKLIIWTNYIYNVDYFCEKFIK